VEALIFLWELLCGFLPHKQANDFDMARNLWQKAFRFCDFLGCPTSKQTTLTWQEISGKKLSE